MRDADFLHAICRAPDDDAPRLMYADWLDEQGNESRAEFIRLQIAIEGNAAATNANDLRRLEEMQRRATTLLTENLEQWEGPLRDVPETLRYRRGFIEEIEVGANGFAAVAEELLSHWPLRRLQLFWGAEPPHERARFMQTLAGLAPLARLRALDLSDSYIGSDGARALAVSENLGSLESLNLRGGRIGERGARALAEAAWLPNLTALDLSQNDVNAAAAHALAQGLDALDRAGRLRLRELALAGNPLRQAGARVVRASPALRRVARL